MALVCLVTTSALAEVRAYRGAHPLDAAGHWHDVDGVHAHDDLPLGLEPFAEVDGALIFLADPLAFGFTGDVWSFIGAHPIPGVDAYCALAGSHRHAFAPEGNFRREDDGGYRYVGALRGGLAMVRPRNAQPVATPRPIVAASAPMFWGGCPMQTVWGPSGPMLMASPWCLPPQVSRPASPAPLPAAPVFPRSRRFGHAHPAAGHPIPESPSQ